MICAPSPGNDRSFDTGPNADERTDEDAVCVKPGRNMSNDESEEEAVNECRGHRPTTSVGPGELERDQRGGVTDGCNTGNQTEYPHQLPRRYPVTYAGASTSACDRGSVIGSLEVSASGTTPAQIGSR